MPSGPEPDRAAVVVGERLGYLHDNELASGVSPVVNDSEPGEARSTLTVRHRVINPEMPGPVEARVQGHAEQAFFVSRTPHGDVEKGREARAVHVEQEHGAALLRHEHAAGGKIADLNGAIEPPTAERGFQEDRSEGGPPCGCSGRRGRGRRRWYRHRGPRP